MSGGTDSGLLFMSIFYEIGLSQLPRILGLMDRDPASKTYGCCDRQYWHYKLIDFPNSRMQEAALIMALAWRLDLPGNRFFGSSLLKDWAAAAIDFWSKRLHGDGSTDESYPYERHFCSTAFTLYSITEALNIIGIKTSGDFTKTGEFLLRRNNMDVANQMACAAAALWNLHVLTKADRFRVGAEQKIASLLSMQSESGYFNEYGGFDLGYDSITLSFLAGLYLRTKRQDIKQAAEHCIKNMRSFVDESGYFSPETMSRKTQFIYPYGLAVFAPDVLRCVAAGAGKGEILNPSWMDDRYCVPFTGNYLMTAGVHV